MADKREGAFASHGAGELGVEGVFKMSEGRIPMAKAAASEPGRFAANEDTIFFKNL